MAWQRTVTHNNDNISDNYDNDDNAHSHREQHSHTAPDLPPHRNGIGDKPISFDDRSVLNELSVNDV